MLNTKDEKVQQQINAVISYLTEGWDNKAPLEYRINYMLKEANKYAKGFPEWSDIYGIELQPIDNLNKNQLEKLINIIKENLNND